MLPTPLLLDSDLATWLRDADGNVRAAAICWGIVLSAFIILRIPREVLLGCLIAAGTTVGLAATVVDMNAGAATASSSAREVVSPRPHAATSMRSPTTSPAMRERPY
ncbi:MAG: hypothetical protein HC861_03335 [Rhodospirillaceae bacterium]|nr:hypothetical protein [Rhodospirillaceae bacterium]